MSIDAKELKTMLSPHSDLYDWRWDREAETFDTGTVRFNITKAKKIIKAAPRPVVMVSVGPYAALLEMMIDLIPNRTRTYDLDFPVIIATLKRGGTVLIDGWHRLDRALKEGRTELPAVFLTREETKLVRRT